MLCAFGHNKSNGYKCALVTALLTDYPWTQRGHPRSPPWGQQTMSTEGNQGSGETWLLCVEGRNWTR